MQITLNNGKIEKISLIDPFWVFISFFEVEVNSLLGVTLEPELKALSAESTWQIKENKNI